MAATSALVGGERKKEELHHPFDAVRRWAVRRDSTPTGNGFGSELHSILHGVALEAAAEVLAGAPAAGGAATEAVLGPGKEAGHDRARENYAIMETKSCKLPFVARSVKQLLYGNDSKRHAFAM